MIEFAVLVCLFVYLPDDDLVEVETCRRNISDKRLFIIDCAVHCIKHRTVRNIMYPTVYTHLSLQSRSSSGKQSVNPKDENDWPKHVVTNVYTLYGILCRMMDLFY